jgi:hypothetical protein
VPLDLFWQIRAGHDMLTHHQIIYSDPYSWTRHGAPWVVQEWLTYTLFWKAYQAGNGFGGIWLLQVVLVAGIFALLYGVLTRLRQCHPLLAFLLVAGAATLTGPYLSPRPQLITYLFLITTMGLLFAAQSGRIREYALWALVPLYILWFNMHAGALVGVGLIALTAIGIGIERTITSPTDSERPALTRQCLLLVSVAVACFFTVLITPSRLNEIRVFLATINNSTAMSMVGEWRPLNFHEMIGKASEILILLATLGFALSRERRRIAEVLIALVFVHEAFQYTRNIPLFVFTIVVMSAPHIQSALVRIYETAKNAWPKPMNAVQPADLKAATTLFSLLFIALTLYRCGSTYKHINEAGFRAPNALTRAADYSFGLNQVPESACRFMRREEFPSTMRMFNEYGYGGYLIFRLPNHPVFIDGRADVYFGKVLNDYYTLDTAPYDWQRVLAPYNVDLVFTDRSKPLTILFMNSPEWALVYVDSPNLDQSNNTLIFVRRLPQYQDLISRCRRDCAALAPSPELANYANYPALH